nr:hypothetical protein [Tanacetum cinerariifolium]
MKNILPKPDLIGELGKIKEVIEELETKLQVPKHPVNLGVPEDQIIAPQKQHRKGRQIKPVDGYSWVRYHQYIPLDDSKPKKYYFKSKYHKVCRGKAKISEPPNIQAFVIYTFEHSCGGGHGDHGKGAGQGVPGEGASEGVPGEGDVWKGKGVHGLVTKTGCFFGVAVCNALVDMYGKCKCFFGVAVCNALVNMYGKCNCFSNAMHIFEGMVMLRHGKEIHGYMITNELGNHNSEDRASDTYINNAGFGNKELDVFRKMCETDVTSDEVIFVRVLSACSHSGLVEKGQELLSQMRVKV